jgi:DNA-binding XRE family transcriptional regulator
MIAISFHFVCMLCGCLKPRRRLEAEILVVRHRLGVPQQRAPRRLHLRWERSMLNLFRALLTAALFVALVAPPCCADPAPVIHYAPIENLEHIDPEHEIDMAAYVLTDWPVMQALTRAARGLLHWTQNDLAREAGVSAVTIRNYENGKTEPNSATLVVLQQTFERAGVEFIADGRGVQLNQAKMSKTLITIAAAAGSTG